jgi:hypothetical protein
LPEELHQTEVCNTHECFSSGECHADQLQCSISAITIPCHKGDQVAEETSAYNVLSNLPGRLPEDHPSNEDYNVLEGHAFSNDPDTTPKHPCVQVNGEWVEQHERLEVEHYPRTDGENSLALTDNQEAMAMDDLSHSNFQCVRDGQGGCTCHCESHPQCTCQQQGQRIKGSALLGNVYNDVQSVQDCCNLCTNHPDCAAWEITGSTCSLKGGSEHEDGDAGTTAGFRADNEACPF